jgi:hypothetical protein
MATVLEGVHGDVVKVSNESLVEGECPQNFNLLSGCFMAVTFSQIDLEQRILVSKPAPSGRMTAEWYAELHDERRLWTGEGGCCQHCG